MIVAAPGRACNLPPLPRERCRAVARRIGARPPRRAPRADLRRRDGQLPGAGAARADFGRGAASARRARGDRIALLMRDTPECAAVWLGAVHAGMVALSVNPRL